MNVALFAVNGLTRRFSRLLVTAVLITGSLLWSMKVLAQVRSQTLSGAIDIHAHIGLFRGFDLSEETLLWNMKNAGVRVALVSNIDGASLLVTRNLDEINANTVTLKFVRANKNSVRGLLWARPDNGNPANLERFLNHKDTNLFVGIKFHPEFNRFNADDRKVDAYLTLCGKYKIPALFHSGQRRSFSAPDKIYNIAKRHPQVPVILYHMGFYGPHDGAISVVKESIERKDALLYLETAQANPESVINALKTLGSDRILFGTDASYYGRGHYERYLPLIEMLHSKLTPSEFENVMWRNAERLFRVPSAETITQHSALKN